MGPENLGKAREVVKMRLKEVRKSPATACHDTPLRDSSVVCTFSSNFLTDAGNVSFELG